MIYSAAGQSPLTMGVCAQGTNPEGRDPCNISRQFHFLL